MTPLFLLLLAILAGAVWLWPRSPLRRYVRKRGATRQRIQEEDVLKHICTRSADGHESSAESVAGALGIRPAAAMRLSLGLEEAGLLASDRGKLRLTPAGEDRARRLIRAHRLWETYLSHEARAPLSGLHKPAEAAEHQLTLEQIEQLDASLGHPRRDPHGDPIPRGAGDSVSRTGDSLADWPAGPLAEITHVEDEPDSLFQQAMARGLRPGATVEVLRHDSESLHLRGARGDFDLPRLAARNIQVGAAPPHPPEPDVVRLSDLKSGESATVLSLDAELQGMTRRRLLDLGLTPGSAVEAYLDNAFGDPRAFRVRGTTIALREDQASRIWVRRVATSANQTQAREMRT
jgi:DtxR family Mn-dependent transcriptional regulator